MALVFMDGFDAGDFPVKWSAYNGGTASSTTTRFGVGRSMSISNYFWNMKKLLPVPVSNIFVGWAMYTATGGSTGSDTYMSLWGDDGSTMHLRLLLNTSSTLRVARGDGTTLATSATGTFIAGQWNYIEMSGTIADSGGRCVVRVNGVTVIDFTGDTKNGGTSTQFDTIVLGDIGGNVGPRVVTYFDDLYVCDATGPAPNNTFIGDTRIQTISPNAAGSSTQMTPSTGANYAAVDELPYSATDYVRATPGQLDTYSATDLSADTGTIYGLQTCAVVKKTDAGTISAKTAVKSGATTYFGANVAVGTIDQTVTDIRAVDPNTSAAWTTTAINAIEIGIGSV
jgi:hypothetical protein